MRIAFLRFLFAAALPVLALLRGESVLAAPDRDDPQQIRLIARHVEDGLPPGARGRFAHIVYVDKAQSGPFAQRMFVFAMDENGALAVRYDWPVSTGRERNAIDAHGIVRATSTPEGVFELDPLRLYDDYRSWEWDQDMPYAMFLAWRPGGRPSGVAIHGVGADESLALGRRASMGCVHLSRADAKTLYELVHADFRIDVPELVYQAGLPRDADLAREGSGALSTAMSYSVLVLIDGFAGATAVSALP